MAGPRDHYELRRRRNIAPAVPRPDFREGVGAKNEIQPLGLFGEHFLNSEDRIALPVAFLEARWLEARIAGLGAGQLHHAKTVGPGSAGALRLVRRAAGWDKKHTIESKSVGRFPRHGQMGAVNGIESPSEDRDWQVTGYQARCKLKVMPRWASIAVGVVVALICVALLFLGAAYLTPRFLQLASGNGGTGRTAVIIILVACLGGLQARRLQAARARRRRAAETDRERGRSPLNLTSGM